MTATLFRGGPVNRIFSEADKALAELKAEMEEERRQGIKPQRPHSATPNCLVVEDSPNDAHLSSLALGALGIEVTVAHTGDEAIKLLDQSRDPLRPDYQICFLDMRLRGSRAQGIDVLRHIRKEFPGVHVVVLSGHLGPEDFRALQSDEKWAGYIGFIAKPLRRIDVQQIVQQHRLHDRP